MAKAKCVATATASVQGASEQPSGSFTALGISAHANDLDQLREIFSRMNWRLHEAQSCHEATIVLCSYRMPIVVCDRSLPDGNWKDILSLTAPLLEPPRVIVMSGSIEASWPSEVMDMHGYGVLAKPLDEGEVTRVVVAACQGWQGTSAARASAWTSPSAHRPQGQAVA